MTCTFVMICPSWSQINPEPLPCWISDMLRLKRSRCRARVVMKTTEGEACRKSVMVARSSGFSASRGAARGAPDLGSRLSPCPRLSNVQTRQRHRQTGPSQTRRYGERIPQLPSAAHRTCRASRACSRTYWRGGKCCLVHSYYSRLDNLPQSPQNALGKSTLVRLCAETGLFVRITDNPRLY